MAIIDIFSFATIIACIAITGFGYKKSNRNLLLSGTFLMFISLAGPAFLEGFKDGYSEAYQSARTSNE